MRCLAFVSLDSSRLTASALGLGVRADFRFSVAVFFFVTADPEELADPTALLDSSSRTDEGTQGMLGALHDDVPSVIPVRVTGSMAMRLGVPNNRVGGTNEGGETRSRIWEQP